MRTSSSVRALVAFSAAIACMPAVRAAAETAIVVDRSLPQQVKVLGSAFEVDERTGSARLAVDFFDDTWDGYVTSESFAVPGLRFERERGEVVYESAGSVVTCARPKKFLWSTTYPATEACRIVVRSEARAAGAGPANASRQWIVELVTEEPTRAARLSR